MVVVSNETVQVGIILVKKQPKQNFVLLQHELDESFAFPPQRGNKMRQGK